MKKAKYTRKAGGQIPRIVRKMMKRLHPSVEILWNNQANCWCLVQNVKGTQWMLRTLGRQRPTLANTVYVLNASHPARLASKWARERFLEELDQNAFAARVKNNSREAIADGSRELWQVMNNRVVIPR